MLSIMFLFTLLATSYSFGTNCGLDGNDPNAFQSPEVANDPPLRSVPRNLKVAMIGDQGLQSVSGQNPVAVLRMIRDFIGNNDGFVIHAGDLEYQHNPSAWMSQIDANLPARIPYFITIGNHDVRQWSSYQSRVRSRYERSGVTRACSGDIGVNEFCMYKGIHFVLSGVGTRGSGHSSYIDNAFNRHPAPWRICAWHKNQRHYQVGTKRDEVGYSAYDTCRRQGAMILTGHEHSYSRSRLMRSFSRHERSSRSDLQLREGRSFVMQQGMGGRGIRSFDTTGRSGDIGVRGRMRDNPWFATSAARGSRLSSKNNMYVTLRASTNSCQRETGGSHRRMNEAECRTMANSGFISGGWGYASSSSSYPRGCYLYSDGKVYFNTHSSGSSRSSSRPVCIANSGSSGGTLTYGATLCTFNVNGDPTRADCEFRDVNGLVWDRYTVRTTLGSSRMFVNENPSDTLIPYDFETAGMTEADIEVQQMLNAEDAALPEMQDCEIPALLEFPIQNGADDVTIHAATGHVLDSSPVHHLSAVNGHPSITQLTFHVSALPADAVVRHAYLQGFGESPGIADEDIEEGSGRSDIEIVARPGGPVEYWLTDVDDDFESDEVWISPDLKVLVTDLLETGLADDNTITLTLTGRGEDEHNIMAYEASPCVAPTLVIELEPTCEKDGLWKDEKDGLWKDEEAHEKDLLYIAGSVLFALPLVVMIGYYYHSRRSHTDASLEQGSLRPLQTTLLSKEDTRVSKNANE